MTIPYRALKEGHEKPLVSVTLRNPKNGKYIRCLALVDSGSDTCFFDAELGQAIGLDIISGKKSKITGVVPDKWLIQYVHTINIEYAFRSFTTDAGFVQTNKHGFGILGQRGFFDQVEEITFKARRKIFEIIP